MYRVRRIPGTVILLLGVIAFTVAAWIILSLEAGIPVIPVEPTMTLAVADHASTPEYIENVGEPGNPELKDKDAVSESETPAPVIIARPTATVRSTERIPSPGISGSSDPDDNPDIPPRIYWGTLQIAVPWEIDLLHSFEEQVGKQQSIIHWGQQWEIDGSFTPFNVVHFDLVRTHGSIPMFDWTAMTKDGGEVQPDYRLSEIYSGRYDIYIRSWAEAARDWGHPFFLRHNHEMNGWWGYPWAEQINGNQPGDYERAWRHVHDIFTDVGATNVTWVWSPNIIYPGATTPLAELYPGDAYVDWVAMDGYNWGSDHINDWQSFAQVFGPTYRELQRLAPGKPIMLGEWGSAEAGGDKAAWITDALEVQLPQRFPDIRAVVWFNWDGGNPEWTFQIDSSLEALDAFRRGIASPIYAENKYGSLNESPIPPP